MELGPVSAPGTASVADLIALADPEPCIQCSVLEFVAWLTPLWHGVTLCRVLTLGTVSVDDLLHLLYLLVFVTVGLVAANFTYRKRLVV